MGSETDSVLVELSHVSHLYTLPTGKELPVLEDVSLTLRENELVAILGPSGCGKSTLMRIAAGLLAPHQGQARYRGEPVCGPNPKLSLVFQQFALFPWLTVAQNIEQALIPRGLDQPSRRQRVADVISLIGLEGFEETFPRELSGGMKQRVGIARALAVHPELLCMDEPFSQVDALTAEMLRNEVVNLWRDRERYPQSVLLVSHDIHEVAFMASRILVMDAHPGRIKTVIQNPLPYPRDPRASAYQSLVDHLHGVITGLFLPEQAAEPVRAAAVSVGAPAVPTMGPVPLVEAREIIGLLQAIASRGGQVGFFELTEELGVSFTRTLLSIKAAELLGLVETPQDRLVLTPIGKQCVAANRKARKQLFRRLLGNLRLVTRIQQMLEKSSDKRLKKDVILEELAIQYPQEDPKKLFRILVNWGRFAELWEYQSSSGSLTLPGVGAPAASDPAAGARFG